ncbi:MAG TPA: STAS domain-containing protein [Acidimicrobiia bacterium]|nr:STAS domain-containing protein [Acidimicrobiia bacterium]
MSTFRTTHTKFVVCDYPQAVEVEIHGEYDLSSTDAAKLVMEVVGELVGADPRPVIVDLSAVSFFDAAGISFLLRLARVAQLADTTARVRDPNPDVRRLFEIVGLEALMRGA